LRHRGFTLVGYDEDRNASDEGLGALVERKKPGQKRSPKSPK
jgi:hypothetical protein